MSNLTKILLAVLIVMLVGASAVLWRAAGLFGDSGPLIGGPFALEDQHGQAVTDRTYRGKVMLVYFGYTYCPDVCPTTLARIGQALDRMTPGERKQIAPIFITVDPARDTPQQLAQYVPNFHPDLIGLTGSQGAIDKVEQEYKVYAKRVDEPNGGYSMDHSSVVYVMGKDGHFLGVTSDQATPDAIAATLKKDL